jgi:hypothetical protein
MRGVGEPEGRVQRAPACACREQGNQFEILQQEPLQELVNRNPA